MSKLVAIFMLMFGGLLVADDIDVKHEKLLYPVVRVRTDNAGGSGTVVYSEDREESGKFRTYILTNHHVIDSAIKVERTWDNLLQHYVTREKNDLVDVEIFSWHTGTIIDRKTVKAGIIAYDADGDIALLELRSNNIPYPLPVANVAKFATTDVFNKLRVFQKVFVVGCSLGHDPIHSMGDITDLSDLIDGKQYLMSSADVIFGNSGGAVFTEIEGDVFLIGIPARVAVAGFAGAVTHMNWFVPQPRIEKFINDNKFTFLLDKGVTPEESFKKREELRKNEKENNKVERNQQRRAQEDD